LFDHNALAIVLWFFLWWMPHPVSNESWYVLKEPNPHQPRMIFFKYSYTHV